MRGRVSQNLPLASGRIEIEYEFTDDYGNVFKSALMQVPQDHDIAKDLDSRIAQQLKTLKDQEVEHCHAQVSAGADVGAILATVKYNNSTELKIALDVLLDKDRLQTVAKLESIDLAITALSAAPEVLK